MKKTLTIILVLMLAFALGACNGGGTTPPPPPPANGDDNGVVDDGQVFVITAAHASPEGVAMHLWLEAFRDEIQARSNGRIEMNIFPAGQLGGDRELLEGIQAGQITLFASSVAPQVMFVPDLTVTDMLFVHDNVHNARAVFQDQELFDLFAERYAEAGFKLLSFTDHAFRILTANIPINSPADLQGFTVRTSANRFHVAAWELLGANPTPLGIGEVYIALQQGVVDGQENPIDTIFTFGFQEQQHYFMELYHYFHLTPYLMDPVFYNNLPADLQAAVWESVAVATQQILDSYDAMALGLRNQLLADGKEFITFSPAEQAAFVELAMPSWDYAREEVSPEIWDTFWAAIDRVRN